MTRTKEEILHEIKSVMEKYINNTVAQHGGMVEIKDFDMETGKLTMMMKGACSGCAGSTATLKKGIESTMKHYIPEVKTVEVYGSVYLAHLGEQLLFRVGVGQLFELRVSLRHNAIPNEIIIV